MLDWQKIDTWKVLLVDDEPDNCAVMTDVLEFYGMTVRVGSNGKEGLKTLQDFAPTLILLDLSMPQMDGWEMLKHLKSDSRFQSLPVVALTAHAQREDKQRALTSGFDGYLTKPINVASFVEDLRATLEHTPIAKKLPPVGEAKVSAD